jgi:dCTP deaminase
MAVLTKPEIKKALKEGLIKITPLDESQIGPGSVDLTLGNEFRIFKKQLKPYHIKNNSSFEDVSEAVTIKNKDYIIINPGEMIMGITQERITLAENVCGWLEGRSRFARFGLAVHVTAGFMQPGIDNHQVLEIVNLGLTPLALYPGTKICQFIFEKCEGKAKYKGRFMEQVKP